MKKAKVGRIIGKIINVILVAFILLAAGVLVLVGHNAKTGKATTILGYGFMAVQTPSMTPEYPVGTVVIVKQTAPEELKVKDVIAFYSSDPKDYGRNTTHRIIEIYQENGSYRYTTKGDANEIPDQFPAHEDKLIGKVVGKSALLEKLMSVRENPAVFLVVIVLPMCFIITLEMIDISKKMNEKKDEDENKKKKQ